MLLACACARPEADDARKISDRSVEVDEPAVAERTELDAWIAASVAVTYTVGWDAQRRIALKEEHQSERVSVAIPAGATGLLDFSLDGGRTVQVLLGGFHRDRHGEVNADTMSFYIDWMMNGGGHTAGGFPHAMFRSPMKFPLVSGFSSGGEQQSVKFEVWTAHFAKQGEGGTPSGLEGVAQAPLLDEAARKGESWKSDGGSWKIRPQADAVDSAISRKKPR